MAARDGLSVAAARPLSGVLHQRRHDRCVAGPDQVLRASTGADRRLTRGRVAFAETDPPALTAARPRGIGPFASADHSQISDAPSRTGGRAVQGTRLETRQRCTPLAGSNPTPRGMDATDFED